MPKQSCSKRHYAWNLDYSLANLGYEPIYQKLQRWKLWGIFGFFSLEIRERIGCEILFLLNLKDWNEKFQRLFCNTKIQWQNWTFFSIENSKYFEFESNSSYRVEFIKNFRHNNCFHRKIFSITAMQKNFDFEKIFSIITIEDSKDFKPDPILLHLVKYFKNFKDNNYPRTKIFFHHFHQRFNKWRFLSFDSPIYFITLISSRKKTIHSLVETYSLSNLFRLPVDSH